jgi:hypothetical protein
MIVKFQRAWRISKGGYWHMPFLMFACGTNGFLIDILFVGVLISWGEAAKKQRAIKQRAINIKKASNGI